MFITIFINILDSIAPIKEVRIKNRTEPWIDENILLLIKERDKLLHATNRNKKDKNLRKIFNITRNKLQREIKKKPKKIILRIKLKKIRTTLRNYGDN